jgi:hypothetical protein
MPRTLAIMFTMTTYGMWLRGDARGWVDDGVIYPPDPEMEAVDRTSMKHSRFLFVLAQCQEIGRWIGESLTERLKLRIGALTVQPWHVHFVAGATDEPAALIIKCAKDAVRWGLRIGRPIWSDGYDKRFCYDWPAVRNRVAYVERHNLERGWPARPWGFIEDLM